LPPPLERIARSVPESIHWTAADLEIAKIFKEGVSPALQQVSRAEFSTQEWGALLEAQTIVSNQNKKEETVRINYRGPAVEEFDSGINEIPLNQWIDWFGLPLGYRVFLFSLARQLRPKVCLELGTATGLSSLYLAQGLVLNRYGTLYTLEQDERNYAVGRQSLWSIRDHVEFCLGDFGEVMDDLLPSIPPPDLVFADCVYVGEESVELIEHFSRYLNPDTVVIYGGVHWSNDLIGTWEKTRSQPEVEASLDLSELGVLRRRASADKPTSLHFTATSDSKRSFRRPSTAGVKPENLIWIFGSPRSGTTWLRDMMQEVINGSEIWEEPFVGALFGHFYYEQAQKGQLKAKNFILGEPIRAAWIKGIREFVLEVAKGRFPKLPVDEFVIVKEPSGSVGAPLLLEAFPESRMVLLIRDPRDVAASFLDASRKGAWLYERRSHGWIKESNLADRDPDEFVKRIAEEYMMHVENAKRAYEAHSENRRARIRYEDLRSNTLETLYCLYSELEMPVDEETLAHVVKKYSWENIPEEQRGARRFYRKGTPGGWREDLTPKQVDIVERITASLLEEFYGVGR
jgi:hypothetical protein